MMWFKRKSKPLAKYVWKKHSAPFLDREIRAVDADGRINVTIYGDRYTDVWRVGISGNFFQDQESAMAYVERKYPGEYSRSDSP